MKSCRSISISVGLKRGSSSCSVKVKPERALLRLQRHRHQDQGCAVLAARACRRGSMTESRAQGTGCSRRLPARCVRAVRNNRPAGSRVRPAQRRRKPLGASRRRAHARVARLRAHGFRRSPGCADQHRPSDRAERAASESARRPAGPPARPRLVPRASAPSCRVLKFSKLLRSDKSSSLRCQRASRSLGFSVAGSGSAAWRRRRAGQAARRMSAPTTTACSVGGAVDQCLGAGQRLDALQPSAPNVDRQFERFFLLFR